MDSYRELERVFARFDFDGDGKVSPKDLKQCVSMTGGKISIEEAEAAVRSIDSDGNGVISVKDFAMLMKGDGKDDVGVLKEAFEIYDMEKCGFITPKSLKRMLGRLGHQKYSKRECQAMIRRFDINGDGVLSFDEFKLMMMPF